MTVEINPLEKKKNPEQPQTDLNQLKDSLHTWGEKAENNEETAKKEAEKIVQELVSSNLPAAEMESILNKLPIAKRFMVEKMILDEQKHQIATMSQERYKQYLQAQFPSGVPSNVSEMALSMVADTSEMYKTAQKKIEETKAEENPSEVLKKELKTDQREAIAATQMAEQKTQKLSSQLSQTSQQEIV